MKRAIANHEHVKVETPIVNTDRAIPSRIHGEVAKAQEGQEAQGEEGRTAVRHDGDP